MIVLASLISVGCRSVQLNQRLTVGSAGKISSLDPAQASTLSIIQLLSAVGDPLYSLNRDGTLQPRLAVGLPELTPDGLTVTIPLRKDVRFHDGSAFNAEAMAFSLRRFLRIGTLSYVVGDRIRAVDVVDTHTIRLQLSRPSTSLQGLPVSYTHLTLPTTSKV